MCCPLKLRDVSLMILMVKSCWSWKNKYRKSKVTFPPSFMVYKTTWNATIKRKSHYFVQSLLSFIVKNILFTMEWPGKDGYHYYRQRLLEALVWSNDGGSRFSGWVHVTTHQRWRFSDTVPFEANGFLRILTSKCVITWIVHLLQSDLTSFTFNNTDN